MSSNPLLVPRLLFPHPPHLSRNHTESPAPLLMQINCDDGMFRALNGFTVGDEEERLVSTAFHKTNQVFDALADEFGFVYECEVGTEAIRVRRIHQAAEVGP